MSRFLKVMIVLLAVAAMAAPAIAADNLSLSGSMRVRGAYLDDGGDDSSTTVDQRLRVGGTFTATDAISLTFRTDFSEGTWGADNGHGRFGTIQDMDRAHLDIDTDSIHFRAGTQYWALGNVYAFDHNGTGATMTIKGDVPVTLAYTMIDNNGDGADDQGVAAATSFNGVGLFAVYVWGSADEEALGTSFDDMMNATDFVDFEEAVSDAAAALDKEIYLFGVTYDADFDGIKLSSEIDYFDGEVGYKSDTEDVKGLQAMVDVSMAVSETATVGGRFFYAQGHDDDLTVAYLGSGFGGYDPLNYGPYENENLQNIVRPFEVFSYAGGLINEGVYAAQVYASVKASDAVTVTGSLAYAEPEDDFVEDNDALFVNAGVSYALMQNATIKSQLQYVDYDESLDVTSDNNDAHVSVGLGLWVNF